MNLRSLSLKLIEEAITKGRITLQDGVVRELTPAQILSAALRVAKEDYLLTLPEKEVTSKLDLLTALNPPRILLSEVEDG